MEDGAVVQFVRRLAARHGMGPFPLALSEFDKVSDCDWGVFRKETYSDLAFSGIEDGISAGSECHGKLL